MVVNITIDVPQPYNNIGDGPEGPEVRTMTDHLDKRITGCTIMSVFTEWPKLVESGNWHQGVALLPAKVIQVTCKAKFMYWKLYSLSSNVTFYLTCTVLMSGKWLFAPGDYTKALFILERTLPSPVSITSRQLQYQSLNLPLFFDSKRGLSKLIFKFTEAELSHKLKEYGPDLLQEDISATEYISRARNIRSDTMSVCKFLLNQKYFSGVGNYLKSEILFRAGIHPKRTVKSLTESELTKLLKWSMQLIRESYMTGGVSISDYESPTGELGQFKLLVYNQQHADSRISYAEIDGRGTYWREDSQF